MAGKAGRPLSAPKPLTKWPPLDGSQATVEVTLQRKWLLRKFLIDISIIMAVCILTYYHIPAIELAAIIMIVFLLDIFSFFKRIFSKDPAFLLSESGLWDNLHHFTSYGHVPWRLIEKVTVQYKRDWYCLGLIKRPALTVQVLEPIEIIKLPANKTKMKFLWYHEFRNQREGLGFQPLKPAEIKIFDNQVKCDIRQLCAIITQKRDAYYLANIKASKAEKSQVSYENS